LAAVRLDAGHSGESFAVAVESNNVDDPAHDAAHQA
jgi:fatty-acyl-CoA synthase